MSQQLRESIREEEGNRDLIHDRDSVLSGDVDLGVKATGMKILKTPFRVPTANACC